MRPADVAIVGAGPAGAAASLLLASWGHSVQLISKAGVDHRLAVSLPPSCGKLFDAIGVADAIARADFLRSTGNTVWWGGADARVEPFASHARGWQVEVSRLADVILGRAIAAGVNVERRLLTEPPEGVVLDCTGRAGVLAHAHNVRRQDPEVRTIALIGEWRHRRWAVPDQSHTLVESYDDGWMWSVPADRGGVRHIAAMVDPQRSGLARGVSSKDVYRAEIAKTRAFRKLTADATLLDNPRGWDASQYDAARYAGDDWLLVGDAGSFIDPLSSAGVQKALASGWLAAVVAHTCLETPSMKAHAFAFFNAREQDVTRHLQRESARFLSDAAAGHPRPFWDERSQDDREQESDPVDVRRAFEALKSADTIALHPGHHVSIEPRPIIRANEIVLEPHLAAEGDRAVRYVNGVDVVAVLELAPHVRQVPDLYDAYEKRVRPTPLPDFLHALATAVARGWLVSQ